MPLLPIFAGAATGFATMRADGTFILSADGTFGMDKNCCCCQCSADKVSSSYAVTFKDGVDFTYADTGCTPDTGNVCTPDGTYVTGVQGHPAAMWSYIAYDLPTIYPDLYPSPSPFSCDWYGAWWISGTLTNGGLTYNYAKQSNGVYIDLGIAPSFPPGNYYGLRCVFVVQVTFGVCIPNDLGIYRWVSANLFYTKTFGDTPVGTYTIDSALSATATNANGLDFAKVTYPETITIS